MTGTYGGHLELSAFAHLKRRNVKVIQPGLVYIIEWNCSWVVDSPPLVEEEPIDETKMNERDKRRLRRDRIRQEKEKEEKVTESAGQGGTVYVACVEPLIPAFVLLILVSVTMTGNISLLYGISPVPTLAYPMS